MTFFKLAFIVASTDQEVHTHGQSKDRAKARPNGVFGLIIECGVKTEYAIMNVAENVRLALRAGKMAAYILAAGTHATSALWPPTATPDALEEEAAGTSNERPKPGIENMRPSGGRDR